MDKCKVSLMNRVSLISPRSQLKIVLLKVLTIRCKFLITLFLVIKCLVGISFQIGDSLSALYLYSCVNFHRCVSVAF